MTYQFFCLENPNVYAGFSAFRGKIEGSGAGNTGQAQTLLEVAPVTPRSEEYLTPTQKAHIERLAQLNRGRKRSDAYKKHLSEIRMGEQNPFWKGDNAKVETGRARALSIYRDIGPCTRCGNPKSERHHIDGNTLNNNPKNIEVLCRRCHMQADGRLDKFRKQGEQFRPVVMAKLAALADMRRAQTHCHKGHPLSGDNVHHHRGHRICKTCRRERPRRGRRAKS